MEPFKPSKLPIEYNIDKELLKLISEANEKYGEYKSLINTLEFDSRYFLDSILLSESLKSTQIEGTQISQDELFYLKYLPQTDDNKEITLHEGEVLPELIGKYHYGKNTGKEPIELIVFYLGQKGTPLSVNK